jgi:hypothetical protein
MHAWNICSNLKPRELQPQAHAETSLELCPPVSPERFYYFPSCWGKKSCRTQTISMREGKIRSTHECLMVPLDHTTSKHPTEYRLQKAVSIYKSTASPAVSTLLEYSNSRPVQIRPKATSSLVKKDERYGDRMHVTSSNTTLVLRLP